MNATRELVPDRTTPPATRPEPLDELAGRCRRLADVVESVSRRRDVRDLRARLVLVLLALRCPLRGRPRRPWYVPGAVARCSLSLLRLRWRLQHGEEPPCDRTLRAHLGVLERARALVRSPGEWLPVDGGRPGWRPRHADTVHLLEDDAAAEAWASCGPAVLRRRPEVRRDPDAWRLLLGPWRSRARQLELFEAPPVGLPDQVGLEVEDGASLRRTLQELGGPKPDALDLERALARHGARLGGRAAFELAADPRRLLGAACLLAVALERGDAVRNRAGWLVRAFRRAPPGELRRAAAGLRPPPDTPGGP